MEPIIALVVLIVVFILLAVKTVPQGMEYTVERFGQYTKTFTPGLNFIVPFYEKVGAKVSVRETVLDVPRQEVITKDNAMVQSDGVVFFKVEETAKAAYQVNNLTNAILNLVMTNIRSVMGSMDLDELLSNREMINAKLMTAVNEAATPWGVRITRVEIRDISPPADLVDAMASQMKAERQKRAEILEAEGEKTAAILRSEGAKQSAILEAEGKKEAAFRDAEAREREAAAEAKATEMVSAAISSGNAQAINYFVAQEYVKSFAKLAESPNQKTIFLPLEASQMLGSLGGIGEIVKETFMDKK